MTGRGPGWPTVLGLMLVVLTFSVAHPLQLVLIPLALLLVALPHRTVRTVIVAAVLVVLAFSGPRGPLWFAERGWTLLLGSWFVIAIVAWPRAGFTARALAATAGAALSAGLVVWIWGGWDVLDWTIASHYRELADAVARSWPGGGADATVIDWTAALPARLFPALLGIGSIAALAVAWWGYRRLTRSGHPLGRLTEFRFPDALIWVLILGIAMLVVPLAGWAPRVGSNLVVFMAALYVVRGLGVMVALVLTMVGSQVAVLVALGLVAILLYPIVVAGMLLLGVTDTWLDLRAGRRAETERG